MAGCTFEITRPAQNIIVSDSLVKLFRHVEAEIILRAWDVIDVCLYKTWRDIQHCHTCQIRIQITFVTSRLCHAGENSHIGEMFLHKTLFIPDWLWSGDNSAVCGYQGVTVISDLGPVTPTPQIPQSTFCDRARKCHNFRHCCFCGERNRNSNDINW